MHHFFEEGEILQEVLDYVGFIPGRFYLRACSQYLYDQVSGVIRLNKADFFKACDRRRINPKFLKLEASRLSDSLISKFAPRRENGTAWSIALESVLKGRSVNELRSLGRASLETILACSVIRMNVSIFDIVFKVIELRGYGSEIMAQSLCRPDVQTALLKGDSLELLRRMADLVPLQRNIQIAEQLQACAMKFGAPRCGTFLFDIALDTIPGMLKAYACRGDLERVKLLLSNGDLLNLWAAVEVAVSMRHLDVATLLLTECKKRHSEPAHRAETQPIIEVLEAFFANHGDGPSTEFLTLLFDGIDDLNSLWNAFLLEFACDTRCQRLCHFLVGRGCTYFSMRCFVFTLENQDMLDFLDFCWGLNNSSAYKKDPAVELFLLKRGEHLREMLTDNPIIRILREGFRTASFSNRIELIRNYLETEPTLATKIKCFCSPQFLNHASVSVTPLGVLELFGTPQTHVWTGKNVIQLAAFASFERPEEPSTDEWDLMQPNEIEIQALRDIRTALVEHGADPEYHFDKNALHQLLRRAKKQVPPELIRRVIHGRADVNYQDSSGTNPLLVALRNNLPRGDDVDIIRQLLDEKADPYFIDGPSKGVTPLSWVFRSSLTQARKIEVADILVEYKVDINGQDESGRTPIFRAIARGNLGMVDWLIKRGADLTLSTRYGVRPIDLAMSWEQRSHCSFEIIEKIEEITGQTTDVRDINGLRGVWDLFGDPEEENYAPVQSDEFFSDDGEDQ